MLRFGLIGYGAWGRHHARAIASVPDAELTAICTRSPENAADAHADHPGAAIYADYRELLVTFARGLPARLADGTAPLRAVEGGAA